MSRVTGNRHKFGGFGHYAKLMFGMPNSHGLNSSFKELVANEGK
jgi:hypothetical protein